MMKSKKAKHRIEIYVAGRKRCWEKGQEVDLDDDTIRQLGIENMLGDPRSEDFGPFNIHEEEGPDAA